MWLHIHAAPGRIWSGTTEARSGGEDRPCPPHIRFYVPGCLTEASCRRLSLFDSGSNGGAAGALAGPKLELCTTFQRRCEYELLVGDLICINTLIKNHYLLCQVTAQTLLVMQWGFTGVTATVHSTFKNDSCAPRCLLPWVSSSSRGCRPNTLWKMIC